MANRYCCVPQCNSWQKNSPNLSFHKFPTGNETVRVKNRFGIYEKVNRKIAWIKNLKIGKKVSAYMVVCSLHFAEEDFFKVTPASKRRKLKISAIPSVNLPIAEHGSLKSTLAPSTSKTNRAERLARRNLIQQEINDVPITEQLCEHVESDNIHSEEDLQAADALLSLLNSDPKYNGAKTVRDVGVQVNTPNKLTLCHFITSDTAMTNFTGLYSFKLFDAILSAVNLVYKDTRLHKLSIKERIILTFVKLKWNLSYSVLGLFFGISVNLCKTYFINMLKILGQVLKSVIIFPSKTEIDQNIPHCFEHFEKTQIVLDCTEIFIQNPKCLCCRIRFYSHYKSAQTVKFMTGVSPAGLITYISKPYGGRASDKIIFENSGLITRLTENSAIMVDKGFMIEDLCQMYNIKLFRPPFLRQKNQLDKDEALFNVKIAGARVHIERSNQRIKIFKILGGKLQWSLVPYIEDIFIIACAITNLSSPILAMDKFYLGYNEQ